MRGSRIYLTERERRTLALHLSGRLPRAERTEVSRTLRDVNTKLAVAGMRARGEGRLPYKAKSLSD